MSAYKPSRHYPDYCVALKGGGTKEEKNFWKKELKGADVGLTAHFCIGAEHIDKVRTGWFKQTHDPAGNSRRALRQAIQQIAYYEKRLPKKHWMRGDVHRAYADTYKLLGNKNKERKHRRKATHYGQGTKSSGRPASASADAYVEMSDRMMAAGVPKTAVELLELALKLEPDSREIKRKLSAARAAVRSGGRSK